MMKAALAGPGAVPSGSRDGVLTRRRHAVSSQHGESWMSSRPQGSVADGAQRTWPPVDTTVAHSARRYNYWLGGKDNFAADRESGDAIAAVFPNIRPAAIENRRFLQRVVTYLVHEAGIRQFLDIGTGLPTVDNTHEVAQRLAPESRIAYVDNDPLVLV